MVALAAALARPWATIVLSGAATVEQIRATTAALDFAYDAELDEHLRPLVISPTDYWRARTRFEWN